jgi:hypothetical protein
MDDALLHNLQSGKGASAPAAGLKWKPCANKWPWQWITWNMPLVDNLKTANGPTSGPESTDRQQRLGDIKQMEKGGI